MRRIAPVASAALVLLGALGCGPNLPRRFVLERDVDGWSYRRYQRVLDVELAIEGNPAVGHTATYVRRATRTGREVPFANVFVTVYERPAGLAAEVRRQVRGLATYETEVRDLGGHVWYLDAGPGDRWVLWVSGPHVIKIGASDDQDDVPEEIVSEYMGLYGSDLDEHGRAREGTPSAGEAPEASAGGDDDNDDDTPNFLRENAPR